MSQCPKGPAGTGHIVPPGKLHCERCGVKVLNDLSEPRPVAVSREEVADMVEAKLALIAAMMERRGLFERCSAFDDDGRPRARVVTIDRNAGNADLETDLRFIRTQIDRSLELLALLHQPRTMEP